MRRSGEGTRTWRSASSARSIASFHEAFWCSTNISAIWRPTGDSGLSAVIGSWKIMPMRLPRSSRRRAAEASWISSPSSTMRPLPSDSGRRSRPMTASAVMLLPQPDSPTSPKASPRPISKETFSTALNDAPSP